MWIDRKSTEPFELKGVGENGHCCLLLIHGFTGNPADFYRLARYLNSQGFTVQAIRLPGHGTTPEEMNKTRWSDWWQHTISCFDQLVNSGQYKTVIPIGYSMGGLLALKLAEERPLQAIVTLAAPIYICDRRSAFAGLLKYVKKYIHKQPAISEYMVLEPGAYSKTPVACVASLRALLRRVKRNLSSVTAPIFIGHGLNDMTTYARSADFIYRTVSSEQKQIRYYPQTSHGIMADTRRMHVYKDVLAFIHTRWQASAQPREQVSEQVSSK